MISKSKETLEIIKSKKKVSDAILGRLSEISQSSPNILFDLFFLNVLFYF